MISKQPFWSAALCAAFVRGLSVLLLTIPARTQTPDSASWPLATQAQVDSQGIFLKNLLSPNFTQPLPEIRLADSPAWGRITILTRAQITDLLAKQSPDLTPIWSGPE